MDRQQHWDAIYATKGERDVSWFEASPDMFIAMIEAAGLTRDTCIVDIGGGESHLVEALVERGVTCIAVLDVAGAALERWLGDHRHVRAGRTREVQRPLRRPLFA